jgi:hypothetical protein
LEATLRYPLSAQQDAGLATWVANQTARKMSVAIQA